MTENNMVIDELWENRIKKCKFCHKPTCECGCGELED